MHHCDPAVTQTNKMVGYIECCRAVIDDYRVSQEIGKVAIDEDNRKPVIDQTCKDVTISADGCHDEAIYPVLEHHIQIKPFL